MFFLQFLSCTKRLSLVPPSEEEFGRPESGDRPIDRDWLKGLASNFIDEGLKMLNPRHDKRLNLHGDYVEMSFQVTVQIPYFENWCARMRCGGGRRRKIRAQCMILVGVL